MKDIVTFLYSKTKGCLLIKGRKTIILRMHLHYYFKHKECPVFWASFLCTFKSYSCSPSPVLTLTLGIIDSIALWLPDRFLSRRKREGSHVRGKRERMISISVPLVSFLHSHFLLFMCPH